MSDAFAVQNLKSGNWLTKKNAWSGEWYDRKLYADRKLAFQLARLYFDTIVVRVRRVKR